MKITVLALGSISSTWDGKPMIELDVAMNDEQRLDALAALWEMIGDEKLIAHMEREGFKVERTGNSNA